MPRTSLQTISWGDPQHQQFDHIFDVAAKAGYEGVEIGFRRLGQVSANEARSLLEKHQLELSACHVGGNLADLSQAANEREALDTILSYLATLNCQNLIYSGLNVQSDSELAQGIEQLRAIASGCTDQGITLLYHNHDWEFRNNRHIWNQLQKAEIDGLGYAPDLGWAVKGGQDMGSLLIEIGAAIRVLHFKDFISWADGQNTCHLGEGVVDFTAAWDWLKRTDVDDIWLTAEQDNAEDNEVACQVNRAYMATNLALKEI